MFKSLKVPNGFSPQKKIQLTRQTACVTAATPQNLLTHHSENELPWAGPAAFGYHDVPYAPLPGRYGHGDGSGL